MKTKLHLPILAVLAMLTLSAVAMGGSIWAKAVSRRVPHADDTARKVGDILKIIIEERTTIDNETTRELSKEAKHGASASGELTLPYLLSLLSPNRGWKSPSTNLSMDMNFKREADVESTYEQKETLTDEITVTVADVLPNGNLVVVGSRQRQAAGDIRMVQVSGIVRPTDLTFANSVSSKSVAEFKIVFKKTGVEQSYTEMSLFDKMLTYCNLF
ncbi:MAG: flagellar basal body L-ring protein FlgH [Phycisphaerales bacterium]|nr:flagellar basal body L-ring protein FlgH [Phycisphaerales bacterium]